MLGMGSVVKVKAENGGPAQKGLVINLKSGATSEVCLLDAQENPILEVPNEQLIPTGERMMNIVQWPKKALEYRKKLNVNNACARRTDVWN